MPDFPSETSASGITNFKKQNRFKQSGNWPPALAGLGGTVTKSAGYVTHTFTTSGVFTPITSVPLVAEYLVVGGGGGGGDRSGGGGGAGGFLSGTFNAIPQTAYSVVVGAGGIAGNYEGGSLSPLGVGGRGSDSSLTTIATAFGGSGGGTYDGNATGTFGSGGGGSGLLGGQTGRAGTSGTVGQGNSGGKGQDSGYASGGGGGAGLLGGDAINGSGGNGLQFPIYTNGWSNYFDGNGDYLSVPSNTAFALPGNFTVEAWVYILDNSAQDGATFRTAVIASTQQSGPTDGFTFQINGSTTYTGTGISAEFRVGGTNTGYSSTTTVAIPQKAWNHVAFVRNGTSLSFYLNGINIGTSTASQNIPTGGILTVGSQTIASYNRNINGYISNLRIVKGVALYTGNFIPSTQPITAVNGTSILTCQNSTFKDNSSNSFTVTAVGNAAVKQFGPFNANEPAIYYSTYFDGNGDYLAVPSNTAFQFGTGNFTVEAWIYDTGTTALYGQICGASTYGVANEYLLAVNGTTKKVYVQLGNTGGYTTTGGYSANTWTHLALVRSGTTVAVYANGINIGSYTDSDSVTSTISTTIGGASNANTDSMFKGYISNVRVTKGTALYTANFTPPTVPLTPITNTSLLTCQDNTFVDNSINNFTVTGSGNATPHLSSPFSMDQILTSYSCNFDGSGDYLTLPSNSAFSFGSTENFTIEGWVKYTALTNSGIFQIGATLFPGQNGLGLGLSSGTPVWMLYHSNGSSTLATTRPLINTWQHFAVVRNSGTTRLYVDGVATSLAVSDTTNYTGTVLGIGGIFSTALTMNGLISNFRIVKGTAVYTSNFTPPNKFLTAVSGTSLLTCQNNFLADNSTNNFSVTAVGNATTTLANPFLDKTYYAGGGGGAWSSATGPTTPGGIGGGGNGDWNDEYISAGIVNTGGGGGASRSSTTTTIGRAGGSGIVMIRYPFEGTILPPSNVVATATGTTTVTVTFTESVSDLPITSYTVITSPGNIVNISKGTTVNITGLTTGVTYTFAVYATNVIGNTSSVAVSNTMQIPYGEAVYTTPGTYSWTVPEYVTSISAVLVGGGGSGVFRGTLGASAGGGGGLRYINNLPVTPGQVWTVVVGAGGLVTTVANAQPGVAGGTSRISRSSDSAIAVEATGGAGGYNYATLGERGISVPGGSGSTIGSGTLGGTIGGGNGGIGGAGFTTLNHPGGGGAGGYSGNGGDGGTFTSSSVYTSATAGTGGGGGGAEVYQSSGGSGNGGGGVGIYGQGANGAAGVNATKPGGGGSGGNSGDAVNPGGVAGVFSPSGGSYGGGGGSTQSTATVTANGLIETSGAGGAVRIIWGPGRSFPSNAA